MDSDHYEYPEKSRNPHRSHPMTDPKLPELPEAVATALTLYSAAPSQTNRAELESAIHAYARAAVELAGGGRDGERYRWLRANFNRITVTSAFNREHGYGKFSVAAGTFSTLDAAIDAAMTGGEHG